MNFDRQEGREEQARARERRAGRLEWSGAPGPERLEARSLLSLTSTSFPIPLVTDVEPQGIARGPNGNLWFTETATNQVGEITPAGRLTQFPLPAGVDSPASIVAGPDGDLWFTAQRKSTNAGVVARITTAGAVRTFAIPSKPDNLYGITAGPDGAVWFTESNDRIGRVSPGGVVTEFAGPPGAVYPEGPSAITMGPDGALWFVSGGAVSGDGTISPNGTISRMTTTGSLTTYQVAGLSNGINQNAAAGITTGPDGALWFTGVSGQSPGDGGVGRITTGGVVTLFTTPNFTPTEITTGADGNLWLGEASSPRIGRITPRGAFAGFSVPAPFYNVGGLTLGSGGNIWFTTDEGSTPGNRAGVGSITPAGVATFHAIPPKLTFTPFPGIPVDPTSITTGPDKALWFTEANQIGRISTTGKITQFPLPKGSLPGGVSPAMILSGPEHSLWWYATISGAAGWGFPSPTDIYRITTRGVVTATPLPADVNAITGMAGSSDGSLWFVENTVSGLGELGRIKPNGQLSTANGLFPAGSQYGSISAIATGPDGNLWFAGQYQPKGAQTPVDVLGEVSAVGRTRLIPLPAPSDGGFPAAAPGQLVTGPDGRLWFTEASGTSTDIERISTSGQYASPIALGLGQVSLLNQGTEGRVWILGSGITSGTPSLLAATRNGILTSYPLPHSNPSIAEGIAGMTIGPDGNLWLTDGVSVIYKATGINTVAGGLDPRNRPKDAVDFNASSQSWTNSTTSNRPTFAGLARPGAVVTLYARREGSKAIAAIGHVKADPRDGSWTLTVRQFLSYGTYAITARETGGLGQTRTHYSPTPDASVTLSNALVIKPN